MSGLLIEKGIATAFAGLFGFSMFGLFPSMGNVSSVRQIAPIIKEYPNIAANIILFMGLAFIGSLVVEPGTTMSGLAKQFGAAIGMYLTALLMARADAKFVLSALVLLCVVYVMRRFLLTLKDTNPHYQHIIHAQLGLCVIAFAIILVGFGIQYKNTVDRPNIIEYLFKVPTVKSATVTPVTSVDKMADQMMTYQDNKNPLSTYNNPGTSKPVSTTPPQKHLSP